LFVEDQSLVFTGARIDSYSIPEPVKEKLGAGQASGSINRRPEALAELMIR